MRVSSDAGRTEKIGLTRAGDVERKWENKIFEHLEHADLVTFKYPTGGYEMQDSIRACESEFADLSARLATATNFVGSSGRNSGQRSLNLAQSAVANRLDRVNRKLDALERRVGAQYATDRSAFLREADTVYDEIQAFMGLPRLDAQLRGMKGAEEGANAGKKASCEHTEPWSPSCTQRDPSLSALTSKYGAARPKNSVACPSTGAPELASKYSLPGPGVADSEAVAIEETTMELKSLLIFSALNRKPGQRSSRPMSIPPEPVEELEDLPTIGPVPEAEAAVGISIQEALPKIDNNRLEDAITAALAKACDVRETKKTPEMPPITGKSASMGTMTATMAASVAAMTPAAGTGAPSATMMSIATASKSTGKSSLVLGSTPGVPSTLSAWRSVDEASYRTLPGFVRNQITLEELNATSLAVHGAIARHVESGSASVVFTAADVEEHTTKAKAFVNALVKLNMIKLKVYHGDQIVHYFCIDC